MNAQPLTYRGEQIHLPVGLPDEVVHTGVPRFGFRIGQTAGGDREDHSRRAAGPQTTDGFQSADAGHAQVHEHQVGAPCVMHVDRFRTIRSRPDLEANPG